MKGRIAGVLLAAALLAGCQGSDGTDAGAGIDVVEVLDNVAYYYACGDEVLVLPDGRRFFPLVEQDQVDPSRYDQDAPEAQAMVLAASMTLAVAPPRPGDDIGTLTVYADGMARFVSHRGNTAWLDQEERTYPWVC